MVVTASSNGFRKGQPLDAAGFTLLRAAVLHSFLRRILRFPGLTTSTGSTTGHPEALAAYYLASWQSPFG